MIVRVCELAVAAGATHAREVAQPRWAVEEAVLAACAANACGKFGRCWTCPPQTGTRAALAALFARFPAGVVVQNISALEDSWDFEGMAAAGAAHNAMMRALAREARAVLPGVEVLPLGCGGCGVCERCTCPDAPCRFPDEALGSVEGYGLDVKALVESVGLRYINGTNTVSYVGLLLLRPLTEG